MNKRKACIVTFHCVPNYGAALQTYGLQEVLKAYFDEVDILDYRPETLLHEYRTINSYSFASFVLSLRAFPTTRRKHHRFNVFLKNLNLTDLKYYSNEEIDAAYFDYDYFFLGSDQIWNPDITRGFDKVYFGAAQSMSKACKIAYAASLGRSQYSDSERIEMRNLLTHVNCLSVREENDCSLIKELAQRPVVSVVDPTILAGADVFKQFVFDIPYNKYVLIYKLRNSNSEAIYKIAESISVEKGLEVIEITGGRKGFARKRHKVFYDASPELFISLFYHADFVVTDSFHGTAFSLLFHRPFITFLHKTRGSRMTSLLQSVNLQNRLSSTCVKASCNDEIDWESVELRLSILRKKSIEYIRQSIK